jgi:hypothetical protein
MILTWNHGAWHYRLIWGRDPHKLFQISGDLHKTLKRKASLDDLYRAISAQTAEHLQGATYDLIDNDPPS